ncbi:hypothetical protein PUR71_02180 [Streptomyces sp. SP17BM10]|uniref:hypothetical protein n=1 Tax=Streptomyces sp. SP17BM10 TaxID=3002530 RepID=UPI002E7AA942|nr:hypothetical protein [Streptomyces sp. SP17BM10]MEE1781745.1 hypothetical protein [Streptomyces sp. SP17BM10]
MLRLTGYRPWVLGVGALVVAGLGTGGALLAFGAGESDLAQTLCGQPRAKGTPLGTLLPKGRPGADERKVQAAGNGQGAQTSCTISVDGQEALSIVLFGLGPDQPSATDGHDLRALVGRGPITGGGGSGVTEYWAGSRTDVVSATVLAQAPIRPRAHADSTAFDRALGQLAQAVVTGQQQDVCR